MCGIVGFKSNSKYTDLRNSLQDATVSMRHRGPDDSGAYLDEENGVGLGHRRLSIIDLSPAGRQPMASDDGQVLIVHNGEVYNFKAIRKELEQRGHSFQSRTDTEVILKSYLEWGIDCLQRFVGMFAFALWDKRSKSLVLARDRLGIKPLYYYQQGRDFVFASELKAIMVFNDLQLEVDPDSLALFLHYQYVPAPKSIFKQIRKLLPGHYLIWSKGTTDTRRYWEPPRIIESEATSRMSEEEYLVELDRLIRQAVGDRLISDVSLGALLSGGIDSSLVVAIMQKVNNTPVKTFTIGFKEGEYNEAPFASKIAEYLGTSHTELYVTPKEALNVIPRLPELYDEPFADSSAIPTFLVCRLARSHITVALSGDGGDEQFCGYIRYWTTRSLISGFEGFSGFLRTGAKWMVAHVPSSWVERVYKPCRAFLPAKLRVRNFQDKWERLKEILDTGDLSEAYRMTIALWSKQEVLRLLGRYPPHSRYEEEFEKTQSMPLMAKLMKVDQETYLPDAMLTKVDRASMGVGLEVRVPLLDHRLVEFTSSIPDGMKFRNGTGKYILKKLLSKYVPPDLFERPKMGFGVPLDQWFRKELKDLLTDLLSPQRIRREGLFDEEVVREKVEEHLTGRINHQYRLWPLIVWEMWRDKWLGW
ncbi:MAG: asparagine synthase (glutamine-hydrolyzing) [Deltaproteobacteria bacterium]|nr:asparagine synthase (glutamine-hydrolyzing) [Deltaproteobacteria bacterium]